MKEVIHINSFKAVDNWAACLEFHESHLKVLKSYNLTQVTSLNAEWLTDPNVYVFTCVREHDNKMIAGLRIHIKDQQHHLPLEDALNKINYKLNNLDLSKKKVGEICGIWKSENNMPAGLFTKLLTHAGVAVTYCLKLNSMVAFSGQHSSHLLKEAGFIVDKNNSSNFLYPNKSYISNILVLNNLLKLRNMPIKEKALMSDLIKKHSFTKSYVCDNHEYKVKFHISHPKTITADKLTAA